MPLEPLRRSPLAEQAADRLRERIASGDWTVGTRLPGETTLAKELGVGRSTVREAIRAVAGAGMVESRQGSGVYVLATEPRADWDQRLRRAALVDVFEVRALLEPEAARLAATRRDNADLAALDAALAARTAAANADAADSADHADDEAFVAADIVLHTAVVAAAHNPVLAGLFQSFRPRLRSGLIDLIRLVPLRAADPAPGHAAHVDLVTAIKIGDSDRAAAVMRAEVDHVLTLIRAHLAP